MYVNTKQGIRIKAGEEGGMVTKRKVLQYCVIWGSINLWLISKRKEFALSRDSHEWYKVIYFVSQKKKKKKRKKRKKKGEVVVARINE